MPADKEPSILVVDDEPSILVLISAILQKSGMRALLARSCQEALEITHRLDVPIDLVMSDVMMPDMQGPELDAQIKLIRPEVRVLYMSAFSEGDVLRLEARRRGAPFLGKPFDNGQLVEAIQEALSSERAIGSGAF